MFALSVLVSGLWFSAQDSVVLYRGAELNNDRDTPYYSCEDTSVVRDRPQSSFGQGLLLFSGKDKRALIRFRDLERAIGVNKRVVSAKLIFTVDAVDRNGTVRLKRMQGDWLEGAGGGEATGKHPHWSTSWSYQFYNEKGSSKTWRNGGEQFVSSNISSEVRVSVNQREIVFEGLERDVQDMYDAWFDNHGWALESDIEIAVNSSESFLRLRPRLELVLENTNEATGADLSVIYISRTPEYERYDNRGDAYIREEVGGHVSGVMMNPGSARSQKWPRDGEQVTYTAFVKNVGSQTAQGFAFEWFFNFDSIEKGTIPESIAPGEAKQVSIVRIFRNEHHDHRTQPIRFKVTPLGGDALKRNNCLEIQANALNLAIWVDKTFYEKFAKEVNGYGSRSFEDWIQWQFRIWNDVFMKHSRFSFAPDGCRETIRVQKIAIVPDGTLKGGAHIPNDTPTLVYDGEWGFDSSFGEADNYINAVRKICDRALIHEMSHQIGLIDLYWMNVDASLPDGTQGKVSLKHNNSVITRGWIDPYGGLMGGGDTRNDFLIPFSFSIPLFDSDNIVLKSPFFMPTKLYSATDVAGLNSNLGYRRGFYGEFLYSVPDVVVVRCVDAQGIIIPNGKLSFYQMKNGEIKNLEPDFTVDILNGSGLLPNRPTGLQEPFTTLTGHTLKPNPFGRIDVVGTNGVFLVKLEFEGQTEWTFLKVWQLFDAKARGNAKAYIHDLVFNVTHRPLRDGNLASRRIVLSSASTPPEELMKLVDNDAATSVSLGEKENDWIEIDLGRDRPIGEIRLVLKDDFQAFWEKFDIYLYATAQTFKEAQLYAKEFSWRNAMSFRRDIDPKDFSVRSVAYRARPITMRYIRIVNRSAGGGKLSEIIVKETEPPR